MGEFNIVLPTLIQQLKSILDQYQDDGQILKELIQNAEDASARTVKFLLDERSFKSEHLHHPELSKFQGPALYAYNDAVFTENDWISLSKWGNSVKKDDPTKVGRFGLGFKSVFHMTDLPMIMSGDKICAIDPHERYFFTKDGNRLSGYMWRTDDNADVLLATKDQFEPLQNIFDENTGPFEREHGFEGTLFRFPLRKDPSKLCDNIYSAEKVRTLFTAFQKAAEEMLVFLMSVERIELYVREASADKPTLVFRVNVHPQIAPDLYMKRQQFLRSVKSINARAADESDTHNKEATLTAVLILERLTQGVSTSDCNASSTYLVSHYCGWASPGESSRPLAVSEKLSYLPWASTAAMLLPSSETEPLDWMAPCPEPRGQLFCFLPLPLQSDSPTGLPVHVNGFFALSSSRHEVKWPSIYDSGTSDDACHWNKYLLENVVPRAYANMLLTLIQKVASSSQESSCSPGSSDELEKTTRHVVYSLFPDPDAVVDRWQGMLNHFYGLIFEECVAFVHTENGGKWVQPKLTLIPDPNEEWRIRESTARCLAAAALPDVAGVASVPLHVMKAMLKYVSPAPLGLKPATLLNALRRAPGAMSDMSDDDRLALLEFILKADDRYYQQLIGLPLLPLMNGSFTSFSISAESTRVYVASNEHPQSLLPRSESLFVDLSERITDALKKMLIDVANSKKTNLCHFNEHYFKTLCRSTVTSDDVAQCHYAEALWEYLHKHFAHSLLEFEGLPFLLSRTESPSKCYLPHQLSRDTPLLTAESNDYRLNENMCNALRHMGVEVVSNISSFIWKHAAVRNVYVFPPSPMGILDVLCISKREGRLVPNNLAQLKASERVALREELSRLDHRRKYTDRQIDLLKSLPLFEVRGQQEVYKSVAEVNEAAPLLDHPPLPPDCRLLDVNASSEVLLNILGVRRLRRAELFEKHLKPVIERATCGQDYIDRVMIEVLHNLTSYEQESSSFIRQLLSLHFVLREDGNRVTPSQVFDPHDAMLRKILFGQKLYPSSQYDDVTVITALRRLGMGNIKSLTEEQLLQCAHGVRKLFETQRLQCMDHIIGKSRGILQFLSDHSDRIGKRTFELLNICDWLIPLPTPPEGYPSVLPWFGMKQDPVSPANIYDIRYATAVGSCSALLPHSVKSSLLVKFGWDKPPPGEVILKHLQNAIDVYRSAEKAAFLPMVCSTYEILQNLNDKELQQSLSKSTMKQWIWHGEGFAQPRNMVLESTDIDCKPYIHVIPNETMKYQTFFKRIGVHQQWSHNNLLDILHMIKERHTSGASPTDKQAQRNDHVLSVKIVQKLAASWSILPDDARERLIIPAAKEELQLLPVEACTYSDSNWLNDCHAQTIPDEENAVIFVHPDIGAALAEKLGVQSLASRMIDSDDFTIGEGFGQSESLTTRLSRLLQDYADGLAVPKELIQNADDAGATEVKFIYDERRNTSYQTRLIDDGMRECQGPALWVFNNAVFSDQDFQDIARISNPQKAKRSEQIGGFGLGFNAVYNLTDVPSFLSRESLVIFDPQKCHLGKSLPGSNQPGIKLNFRKNKKILQTFRNQFLPYDGICGCNIMSWPDEAANFDGTLFRLPLRTPSQASKSEISSKPYDKKEVAKLFEMLGEACRTVLLFTQNVLSVSVLHIPDNGNPRMPSMLFKVTKRLDKVVRKLEEPVQLSTVASLLSKEDKELVQNANILRAAAIAKVDFTNKKQKLRQPVSSMLISIHYEKDDKSCLNLPLSLRDGDTTSWLVVCCMGQEEALKFSMDHQQLSPTGGVAAQVNSTGDGFHILPMKLMNERKELAGQIFCYLPLPIRSQLPVHINGAFALHSSRRALITASGDDKSNVSALWNRYLMEDAIAKAYIILLEDLREIHMQQYTLSKVVTDTTNKQFSHSYHDLWPIPAKASADCKALVSSFYGLLADDTPNAISSPEFLQLFSDGCKWVSLSRSFVLDGEMRSKRAIAEAATTALKVYIEEQNLVEEAAVVDIPHEIRCGFVNIKRDSVLEQRTYGKVKFFRIILPIIARLSGEVRDTLILFALDSAPENDELQKMLVVEPCIPVTPFGEALKRIDQLVNPKSRIACLYSPDEGRFPFGDEKKYKEDRRLLILGKLGMLDHELTEKELRERASNSLSLYDSDDEQARKSACRRASTLLGIIEELLGNKRDSLDSIQGELRYAKFLPYISSESRLPFKWKGDEVNFKLLSPSELYLPIHQRLLCYVEPLLDETSLSIRGFEKANSFLKIDREVPLDAVLRQLFFVTSNKNKLLSECNQETKEIMISIYQFLQDNLEEAIAELEDASQVCYIIVDDAFVNPENVCMENLERTCAPYLYQLPLELRKFQALFSRLGMKNAFTAANIASALDTMKATHKDAVLEDKDLTVAVNIAHLLFQKLQSLDKINLQDSIYLPDTRKILRLASKLSFDNCPWLTRDDDDEELPSVHAMIPYNEANELGVKTIRESTLQRHHLGIPFGQKEELVNRIARIMSAYPLSKEIFYELLQNADDSGATEVRFIKDYRTHPTEKVFEDSWKKLQGPSLCVYNNKSFTKRDLEGIQSLGMGSKSIDPLKTGQYGVGFNSVYHLTDVPSFMTTVKEIGEVLCVLDPHCHYVPGATDDEPGRQYIGLEKLRRKFPDVFSCYLEDLINLNEGTLFRFPLRTPEMATKSKLCSKELSPKELDQLIEKFKNEMLEVLLFVNNLTQIDISEVSRDGSSIQTKYTVQAKLSDEDALKRKEFYEYVHQCSDGLKAHKLRLCDIKMRQVCYTVELEDNTKYKEIWRVVQRIGFNSDCEINKNIENAFASDELRLLPRGGVAGMISPTSAVHANRKKRVFCFLPLPLTTELPVHLNGHFALDYESRRGVWLEDEGGGARSDWNMTLLEEVIAPAYIDFLKDMRDQIKEDVCRGTQPLRLERALKKYFQQYPRVPRERVKIWSNLSASLYRKIHKDQEELLPLVKKFSNDKNQNSSEDLEWLPLLTGVGTTATFFDDTSDKDQQVIKDVLIRAGLRWICDPWNICKFFEASEVKVHRLTPKDVINFIRSEACKHPVPLPCPVEKTLFLKKSDVVSVAKYCLKNPEAFWLNANGLPLGLSQANNLHTLTSNQPLFSSEYHGLLPDMADEFLHESLRTICGRIPETVIEKSAHDMSTTQKSPAIELDSSVKAVKPPAVFKTLSVSDLASKLHLVLDEQFFCGDSVPVPWDHDSLMLPNPTWLSMLWEYLFTQHDANKKENEGLDETQYNKMLHQMVDCLSQWAILPAVKEAKSTSHRSISLRTVENTGSHYLVSIQNRKTVVDYNSTTKAEEDDKPVKEALNAFAVLKLDEDVLSLPHKYNYKGRSLVKKLATSLNNPADVLESVHFALRFNTGNQQKFVNMEHCRDLLKYFSTELPTEKSSEFQSIKTHLRHLPFYETQRGSLVALDDRDVAIVEAAIPDNDFDIWSGCSKVLFLKRGCMPEKLAEFLECKKLGVDNVYYDFIFPQFSNLSPNGREAHLEYIRDIWLPSVWDYQNEKKKTNLLDLLKALNFLDNGDGILRTAGCFYDPDNELLKELWNPDKFPPSQYQSPKWLEFLRQIGLQILPVNCDFIDLAMSIASQKKSLSMGDLGKLAQTLIKQLFGTETLDRTVLQRIRQIPFIFRPHVAHIVRELGVSTDFGISDTALIKFDGSVSYSETNIYCSWSTADFLPDWADPLKIPSSQLKYDSSYHKNCTEYRNYLAKALGILKVPSEKQIAGHVHNLLRPPQDTSKIHTSKLHEVLQEIYTELQKRIPLEMRDTFMGMPCILLEDTSGNATCVRASQLVLKMPLLWQVRPYIMKAPRSLASFSALLTHLGAAEESSVELYASLLKKLHIHYNGRKLTPDDINASHDAVRCLIAHVLNTKETSTLKELYLPSMKDCLSPSNVLVYNDHSAFNERLASSSFDEPFLVDLKTCRVERANFDEAMRRIPQELRPRSLFNIVEEHLQESVADFEFQAASARPEPLQMLLQSEEFLEGLWRLIWHESIDRGNKPSDHIRRKLEKALRSIEVRRSQQLVTYLSYKGRRMNGSERKAEDFISRVGTGTEKERYIIYTAVSGSISMMTNIQVTEIIHRISDGLLRSSLLYLYPMLLSEPRNIEELLDKLRITTRGSGKGVPLHQLSSENAFN